jgi:hypothetical protein
MPVFNYKLPHSRPHTIKEALGLVAQGYPRQTVFGDLADWLSFETSQEKIALAIAAKPDLDSSNNELYYEYIDYLSYAEWLARQYKISVPEWVASDQSTVPDTYYTPKMLEYRNRMFSLFADRAIPEYRNRGIYMTEGNLSRG